MKRAAIVVAAVSVACQSALAGAQTPAAKPWGRVSFLADASRTEVDGTAAIGSAQFTTSVTFQLPDQDRNGLDYGLDFRHSTDTRASRRDRVSIYEGFVGKGFGDGAFRARFGHMWLSDLGALGSVAGGLLEMRPGHRGPGEGRVRAGVFGGFEPGVLDAGYADNVKKWGTYVAYDGDRGRRHVAGIVLVRNASLTERTVLSVTNYVPVGKTLFVYEASEYDVRAPAGHGTAGLAYLFTNVRWSPTGRMDVQATYNRGRSIDARTLSEDVLNGRPITQAAANGFAYESIGGRLTVEVLTHVRIYGGYAMDRSDRGADPTRRMLVGGYAPNVANSGFDVAASDSFISRPDGTYQSRYASVGRQIGRRVYAWGDWSTSLSVVQFSRSDGITVALHPHTRRYSGSASVYLTSSIALLSTLERTTEEDAREVRLLSGITYRFR